MRRAVIEGTPVLTHSLEIAMAAWSPDGAALALVVRAEALPDQVIILPVPSDRAAILDVTRQHDGYTDVRGVTLDGSHDELVTGLPDPTCRYGGCGWQQMLAYYPSP